MTALPRRSARTHRRVPLLLLLATIAAAGAGVALATVLVPDKPATTATRTPSPGAMLTTDAARLVLPDGWQLLPRTRVPGLEQAPGARGVYSDVVIDTRPLPEDASLLPAAMLRALGVEAPEPMPIRTGTRVAWVYQMPGPAGQTRVTALVLPTTRGVVTVACLADQAISPYEAIDCEAALSALELIRAAPLRPAPETAVRLTAGPVIARLDGERVAARRALAAARSPERRAALALGLAAAHEAAARRLEPLARGAAIPLPRVLSALARGYRSLALASARRWVRAARRAGRTIDRRERQLEALLSPAPR